MSCPCGSTVPRYLFATGWWCLICDATEPTWAPFLARLVAGQQVADVADLAEFGRLRRSVEAPRAKIPVDLGGR